MPCVVHARLSNPYLRKLQGMAMFDSLELFGMVLLPLVQIGNELINLGFMSCLVSSLQRAEGHEQPAISNKLCSSSDCDPKRGCRDQLLRPIVSRAEPHQSWSALQPDHA